VLLAVWSQFNLQETRFTLGVTEVAPDQIESLNMVNARFDGIDEKNRPYSVTAELVTQAGESADTIELTGPKADITLESGAWIALTADSGAFSRKAEILDLAGDVSLFHDRGFEMHTESAQIDLAEGVASGDAPVSGQGPAGELEAQGFRVSDDGQRILFSGQARLLINPEGVESEDVDPGAAPPDLSPAAGGVGQ
jgi:lipopolysaccharide export system protein LptC